MSRHELECGVIDNRAVTRDIFLLRLDAHELTLQARPGQFCMLEVGEYAYPLLKRPFSIHDVPDENEIEFIYRVAGKGTAMLSRKRAGDSIRVLGPLGNGFGWNQSRHPVLVGGGLGIAPMLFLARIISEKGLIKPVVILGARSSAELVSLEAFKAIDCRLCLATEDGSLGQKGFVTTLLQEIVGDSEADMVFSCGPMPMLKAVYEIAVKASVSCEVSLEAQMACGIGACLGCAVKSADRSSGQTGYLHVCKEGPVFDGADVSWN